MNPIIKIIMNPIATPVRIPEIIVKVLLRFTSINAILNVEDNRIKTKINPIDRIFPMSDI